MPPPTVESKRSTRPRWEQTFRSLTIFSHFSYTSSVTGSSARPCFTTVACAYFVAPALLRKFLSRSTIISPSLSICRRFVSVTSATITAERFSFAAALMNFLASFAATTQAIRSWLSLIASSVAVRPSYFLGTTSRLIDRLSASSPIATDTPPAPKSLQRFIMRVTSGSRNRRWIFLSSGALPFCTSAPHSSREETECALEEPVAPPQPSRPVAPPSRITTSPSAGVFLTTFLAGAAPITAPTSIRFAT